MQRSLILNPQGILQDANLSSRNIIINGDFQVAQKGMSFSGATSGTTQIDCWQYASSINAAHDISLNSDVPTVAQAGVYVGYSLLITPKIAQASSNTFYNFIRQNIEGLQFQAIAQVPFTLSFWVKASKPGIYSVFIQNKDANQSLVFEYTINTANTWEKKVLNCPASPATGSWDYAAGVGLRIGWSLGIGSNYNAPSVGSWLSANYLTTSRCVNISDTINNQFRLALVEARAGIYSSAVFSRRSYAEELLLCQRYYCRMLLSAFTNGPTAGYNILSPVYFPTPMRAAPSTSLITAGSRYNVSSSPAPTVTVLGNQEARFDLYCAAAGQYYAIGDIWEFNANLT